MPVITPWMMRDRSAEAIPASAAVTTTMAVPNATSM